MSDLDGPLPRGVAGCLPRERFKPEQHGRQIARQVPEPSTAGVTDETPKQQPGEPAPQVLDRRDRYVSGSGLVQGGSDISRQRQDLEDTGQYARHRDAKLFADSGLQRSEAGLVVRRTPIDRDQISKPSAARAGLGP